MGRPGRYPDSLGFCICRPTEYFFPRQISALCLRLVYRIHPHRHKRIDFLLRRFRNLKLPLSGIRLARSNVCTNLRGFRFVQFADRYLPVGKEAFLNDGGTMQAALATLEQYSGEQIRVPQLTAGLGRWLKGLFGCAHHEMSRPFSRHGETYRVCIACGAHRQFDSKTWNSSGPFYFKAANASDIRSH